MYEGDGLQPTTRLATAWRWGGVAGLVAAASATLGYQMAVHSIRVSGESSPGAVSVPVQPASAAGVNLPALAALGASQQLGSVAGEASVPATVGGSSGSKSLTWPLWEFRLQDPLPSREQPLTPVPWRVLGAALFDGRWQAIVQRQGAASPEYYKTGDKLPGGFVIQNITQEDMTLRAGRREIVLAYIGSR